MAVDGYIVALVADAPTADVAAGIEQLKSLWR